MSLRSRIGKLLKRCGARDTGPLTLFLREAAPGLPIGERIVWNGSGREIVFDPAQGPPPLPPGGPHKQMLGMDPDWV
jgi:hypothetical protein